MSQDLRTGPANFLSGLRDDDSLLRQVFFSILRHHHPNLAAKVCQLVAGEASASASSMCRKSGTLAASGVGVRVRRAYNMHAGIRYEYDSFLPLLLE